MATREQVIASQIAPHLHPRQQVLEIGAGKGLVARALKDAAGCEISLIDVVDYNRTDLPLHVYDGNTLPFPDSSFDLSLLVFVLHHTPTPLALLNEALRVSRGGVLVVENHVAGRVRRFVTRWIDSLPHYQYGVPICYQTRTIDEWCALFQELPVRPRLLGRFEMGGFWQNFVMALDKETGR